MLATVLPMTQPPAGWYPDQRNSQLLRYWDGAQWTERYELAPKGAEAPPQGAPVAVAPPVAPGAQAAPAKKPMSMFGKSIILIAIVGIVGGAFSIYGALNKDKQESPKNLEVLARMACEGVVEQNLKSPTSASYSSVVTGGAGTQHGPWTVEGTVDADNSFGAKIRSSYVCTTKMDGDRMVATLVSLVGP